MTWILALWFVTFPCLKVNLDDRNRSMQTSAALSPGVSQQPFKHAAAIRVAGIISTRATPIGKIPIGGAGLGD
jgi:hypothetical protein